MATMHLPPTYAAPGRFRRTNVGRLGVILVALIGLLAAALVVAPAASADGETIVVTVSDDSNVILPAVADCSEGSEDCTLRQAVLEAESGDTIVFEDGVNPKLVTEPGQILIAEKDVVIIGNLDAGDPGTTISGGEVGEDDYVGRLFEVASDASLTISNVALTGGNPQANGSDGHGGAIANRGANVVLDNVRLYDNAADRGGAVYSESGSLSMSDSEVAANDATFGGGLYNVDGELSLTDTRIEGNEADVTGGGLLNLSLSNGEALVTILRGTFEDNSSGDSGGAIMNDSVDQQQSAAPTSISTISIMDTTFRNNDAGFLGGAILNFLDGSTLDISGSTFVGNESAFQGGALFNARGSVAAVNSTFTANVTAEVGGAIMNNGADESALVLSHVTIFGNSAESGGGLYQEGTVGAGFNFLNGAGNTELTHTIIADNVGGDCGGSVSEITGDVRITSEGHNLDSDGSCGQLDSDVTADDVLLGDLGSNGGATMTHLPLEGSPAIEGGVSSTCLVSTDQRGEPRPGANSGACDIGAVEVQIADEPTDQPSEEPSEEPDEEPSEEPEEIAQQEPAQPVVAEPDFTG